jgi:hypothetical protein
LGQSKTYFSNADDFLAQKPRKINKSSLILYFLWTIVQAQSSGSEGADPSAGGSNALQQLRRTKEEDQDKRLSR